MAWLKHTIRLDPMTLEERERVPTEGGFTSRKVADRTVIVDIIIDTGKIRTLGARAFKAKTGKASLHFGAIVAKVVSVK